MKNFDRDVAALRKALVASSRTPQHTERVAVVRAAVNNLTVAIDGGGRVIRLPGTGRRKGTETLVIGTGGGVIKKRPTGTLEAPVIIATPGTDSDDVVLFEKNCPGCGMKVRFP